MALTAEAVYRAFQPDKLNYELLGAGNDKHMHWHFFPRREGDTPSPGPVWRLSSEELYDPAFRPSPDELECMKKKLNEELEGLL